MDDACNLARVRQLAIAAGLNQPKEVRYGSS